MKNRSALEGMRTGIRGITWPPLTNLATAPLAALMYQLEQTQWLSEEQIIAHQHKQLIELAVHAEKYSPHFSARLLANGLSPDDFASREGLYRLPVLSRRELQSAGDGFFCSQIPTTHAPVKLNKTSGSSGEPVVVKRTAINNLFYKAMNLREGFWNGRDFLGKIAIIRANLPPGVSETQNWGGAFSLLFDTGPAFAMPINTDIGRQIEWLKEINPDYLLTYPTNLSALIQCFKQLGSGLPRLRQIRTIGETLAPDVREAANNILGVKIADTYSSEEVGSIAVQCPESGLYHIMSESVMVEVLDDKGNTCEPDQIGSVVVTDLHNFASPIIRYEIGDYAEVGRPCPCGRGLSVLKRILGRQRNMLILPDGRRHWPLVGAQSYREIAPIRQYQLIQRSRELIEVRLVSDIPLTPEQEARLGEVICKSLGYVFKLSFVYFPEKIPRSVGGKFEEFVCETE